MIVEKSYPFGGKISRHYGKIVADEETAKVCIRIGFVPKNKQIQYGEPVLIPLTEIHEFCDDLGIELRGEPERESVKIRLAKKLLGKEIDKVIQRERVDI